MFYGRLYMCTSNFKLIKANYELFLKLSDVWAMHRVAVYLSYTLSHCLHLVAEQCLHTIANFTHK